MKRKEKKDLLQFELSKRKNLQIPLGYISHTLDPFGCGVWHIWFTLSQIISKCLFCNWDYSWNKKVKVLALLNNFAKLMFTNRKTWSWKTWTTPCWSPTNSSGHLCQLLFPWESVWKLLSLNHSRILDSVPMLGGMLPHCSLLWTKWLVNRSECTNKLLPMSFNLL